MRTRLKLSKNLLPNRKLIKSAKKLRRLSFSASSDSMRNSSSWKSKSLPKKLQQRPPLSQPKRHRKKLIGRRPKQRMPRESLMKKSVRLMKQKRN